MNENLTYSKNGLHLTEQFEGCRLAAYQDSKGVWTIGYGHTSGVSEGMTCTQERAVSWLASDIVWATKVVLWHVTIQLTQDEFDALVDFVFNAGSGNFVASTLLKLVNADDLVAAAEQFERWDKCGGQVVAGLLRRRVAEAALFEGGSNASA